MSLVEREQAGVPSVPQWHLGDRLRKARAEAGLEQKDMAEDFGVSSGTISNWEAGAQPRNLLRVVDRWSELTGVPAAWLLTGSSWDRETAASAIETDQLRLPLLTSVR